MLLHARETMLLAFEPVLNQYCLTNQQWRILSALDEYGQLTEDELCTSCQILKLSISSILNRMANLELVEIQFDDSKQKIISLSQKGHQIIKEITPILSEKYNEIEKSYGTDVLDNLHNALDQVLQHNDKFRKN